MEEIKKAEIKKNTPKDYIRYFFFCNCCGNKFEATRADARTCSEICRMAIKGIASKIIAEPPNLSQDDLIKYNNIILKVRQTEGGTIKRLLFRNNNDGTFSDKTNRLKKEMMKSGDDELDAANKKILNEKEEIKDAKAAKKGTKIHKNDKNLIPGKSGREQEKLNKKKLKEK